MAVTFKENLDRLNKTLERLKEQDSIKNEIEKLMIKGFGCRLRKDNEGLESILSRLEVLKSELSN